MVVSIVDATPSHARFLAWVQLTAHRSHLARGLWDFVVDGPTEECLKYLEVLTTTASSHWAHHSTFLVAEVDGEPAAALCGYFEDENGSAALARAFPEVSARCGRTPEQDAAAGRAIVPIMQVVPEHAAGVWIVENVATLPRFRRQGLVDRLLVEALERGRTRGAKAADIGVLIGNDAAQRAYEKVGFRVVSEKRNGEFEAVWSCPGIRGLHREI